jgi:flavodoxin
MNVLVLYQSRNGHTRAAAESIAQAARNLSHTVTLKSIIEVRKADIDAADALFIGTWTQGFILFGVKPAGADLWVPALPALNGKPVGIFSTYMFNPRSSLHALGDRLVAKGATIVGQHAFQRSQPDSGAVAFVEEVLQAAAGVRV